jgi:hypothetical protein
MSDSGTCRGPRMDDVISRLTAEQALKIVERLGRKGGKIREAILTEAMNVLTEVDVDETADEVVAALESIDVQDCWDRSGGSRDGYTSPDEAAAEIFEQELEPFFDQVERYHEMGLPQQESAYCMGVIFGIYRYERESKSEFREWSVDIPAECGGFLLDQWRERNREKASINAMHDFIRTRCSRVGQMDERQEGLIHAQKKNRQKYGAHAPALGQVDRGGHRRLLR